MVPWADSIARVEQWLLPPACLTCHAPVRGGDALVCGICRARWRPLPHPWCDRCGELAPLRVACRLCADWPPDFGPVRSAVRLDHAARPVVHQFKYQGWRRLAELFALRMLPLIEPFGDVDLVPVPLARGRRRIRGYNQAEELAGALHRLTGLPLASRRLQRTRETATQTRLTPESRRANLADAFTAEPASRPALLVDDVFTTGATLLSAAGVLLDGGAAQVGAVTFARAVGLELAHH